MNHKIDSIMALFYREYGISIEYLFDSEVIQHKNASIRNGIEVILSTNLEETIDQGKLAFGESNDE